MALRLERVRERLGRAEVKASAAASALVQARLRHEAAEAHVEAVRRELTELESARVEPPLEF